MTWEGIVTKKPTVAVLVARLDSAVEDIALLTRRVHELMSQRPEQDVTAKEVQERAAKNAISTSNNNLKGPIVVVTFEDGGTSHYTPSTTWRWAWVFGVQRLQLLQGETIVAEHTAASVRSVEGPAYAEPQLVSAKRGA